MFHDGRIPSFDFEFFFFVHVKLICIMSDLMTGLFEGVEPIEELPGVEQSVFYRIQPGVVSGSVFFISSIFIMFMRPSATYALPLGFLLMFPIISIKEFWIPSSKDEVFSNVSRKAYMMRIGTLGSLWVADFFSSLLINNFYGGHGYVWCRLSQPFWAIALSVKFSKLNVLLSKPLMLSVICIMLSIVIMAISVGVGANSSYIIGILWSGIPVFAHLWFEKYFVSYTADPWSIAKIVSPGCAVVSGIIWVFFDRTIESLSSSIYLAILCCANMISLLFLIKKTSAFSVTIFENSRDIAFLFLYGLAHFKMEWYCMFAMLLFAIAGVAYPYRT